MSATALMVFPWVSIHQSDREKLLQTFPGFQRWMFVIAGQETGHSFKDRVSPEFGLISSQTGS